jgi:hypothetical protein
MSMMKHLRWSDVLRAVLVSLVAGWLVSLAFGLIFARLQYTEVANAFPADRVAAEQAARLERELRQGPLLLLAQIGVMAGVLFWQVGATAHRAANPRLQGAAAGVILAFIQAGIAMVLQSPWIFTIPMIGVLIGVGVYAGRAD